MKSLEEIHSMWKKDSIIDDVDLDQSSRDSAKLHSKYLELYSLNKLKLKKLEADLQVLLKNRWLWYNGKLSKEEIDNFGWDYDAMKGLHVLKGDMDYFYNSDPLIQEHNLKIELQKTICETLKDILDNIKWRSTNIRNIIEWRKFTSGF